MTRAPDRLVLALSTHAPRRDAWYHSFMPAFAVPTGDALQLPNGYSVPTRAQAMEVVEAAGRVRPYRPRWFEHRERRTYPREVLAPSSIEAVQATVAEVVEIGERVQIRGDDMADVGNGLHAVIAAELVNPLPRAKARRRARALVESSESRLSV